MSLAMAYPRSAIGFDGPVSGDAPAAERDGRLEQLAEQRDLAQPLGGGQHGTELVDSRGPDVRRARGVACRLRRARPGSGATTRGDIGVESGMISSGLDRFWAMD